MKKRSIISLALITILTCFTPDTLSARRKARATQPTAQPTAQPAAQPIIEPTVQPVTQAEAEVKTETNTQDIFTPISTPEASPEISLDPVYKPAPEVTPEATPAEPLMIAGETPAPAGQSEAAHALLAELQHQQQHAQPEAAQKNGLHEVRPDAHYTPDLYPEKQDEKKDIFFNFEGAELKSFIEYIAEMREMNIIPDKSIKGNKISLNIRKPIAKSGAWNVFLTILDMAGFSLIKAGPVYKVIPKNKKLQEVLPVFINIPAEQLPNNDATIRYVLFLNNINIKEVEQLLKSMLGTPHSLIKQPNVNGLIITDKSQNIKSAMKVIQELDQTGLQESVYVLRLKRANARDVKELFDSLIQKPKGNPLARLLGKQAESSTEYFSPTTKIIAEERTNSLILLGNNKSLEKVKNFIVNHIDKALKKAESPLRIYELQHTNAQEVVQILREVTSSGNLDSAAGKQAAKYGAIRGGVKYFKNMTFQADKEGNRVIVSCTDNQDWELLKKTIRDIDKSQPQVVIQMMMVTVSLDKNKELGGQIRSKTADHIGRNVAFQSTPMANAYVPGGTSSAPSLLGNLLNGITAGQGSTLLSLGKDTNIWGVFKALKTETNASVLSQPFLVTTNRTKGILSFGENKYIVTQKAVGSTGSTGDAVGRESVDAKTTIEVTPQINMDGVIRLDINIDINEFIPETNGSTQRKSLNTNVTVADGQVLVLGGFVKTKVSENGGKTPLLGDIPVLGWLFKNKKRAVNKNYVFIFMCPTIIKPRTSPGVNLYTKMKLSRATRDVGDTIKTQKTRDPIHNWFFNADSKDYSQKVTDFANARYQPTTVDITHDAYYRSESHKELMKNLTNTGNNGPSVSYSSENDPVLQTEQREQVRPASATELLAQFSAQQATQPVAQKIQEIPEINKVTPDSAPETSPKVTSHQELSHPVDPVDPVNPIDQEATSELSALDKEIEEKRSALKNISWGSLFGGTPNEAADQNKASGTQALQSLLGEKPDIEREIESKPSISAAAKPATHALGNLFSTGSSDESHGSVA